MTLVLLHGVGGRASMWAAVEQALQEVKQPALALDLPGYGANDFVPEPYSFGALSQWLAQRLTAVRGPICLVGQSFGGMIALDYAARAQQDTQLPSLAGLVLMNTTASFGKPGGEWQQQFVESRLAPLRAGKSMREVALQVAPGMMGELAPATCLPQALEMMSAVSPTTYELAVRCLSGFDRRSSLGDLVLPVLCVAGEQDNTAPAHVMEKMAKQITQSSYVAVAHGGHLLPLEYPQVCAQLLAQFVSTIRTSQ